MFYIIIFYVFLLFYYFINWSLMGDCEILLVLLVLVSVVFFIRSVFNRIRFFLVCSFINSKIIMNSEEFLFNDLKVRKVKLGRRKKRESFLYNRSKEVRWVNLVRLLKFGVSSIDFFLINNNVNSIKCYGGLVMANNERYMSMAGFKILVFDYTGNRKRIFHMFSKGKRSSSNNGKKNSYCFCLFNLDFRKFKNSENDIHILTKCDNRFSKCTFGRRVEIHKGDIIESVLSEESDLDSLECLNPEFIEEGVGSELDDY